MEYVTIEQVEEAYFECRRSKRRKASSLLYEQNYELNNLQLWNELNTKTYEIGVSICFCVTRPKLREVFAADFRDRIVHHLIMQKFLPLFESYMIEDSYNCRQGKGTLYGVRRIRSHMESVTENYTKRAWVLKCDLQGFFMSIDKDILFGMIRDIITANYHEQDADWWLWLIEKVVRHRSEQRCVKHGDLSLFDKLADDKTLFKTNGKGLPIGNLTSQIFANFYMSKFDHWLMSQLCDTDRYGRYVDDFIIISRDKGFLLRIMPKIRSWLSCNLMVKLHPRKVYLQPASNGVQFVGSVIKPGRTYTCNRTVDNMRAVVAAWNSDAHPDIGRYLCKYNSYQGFLIHNNTYAIRRRIYSEINNRKDIIVIGHFHHLKLRRYEIRKKSHRQRKVCKG